MLTFADEFKAMTREERRAWIEAAVEQSYKRDYEASLAWMDVDGPAWEDLTGEQREKLRAETRRYAQEMDTFGQAIARGETLKFDL